MSSGPSSQVVVTQHSGVAIRLVIGPMLRGTVHTHRIRHAPTPAGRHVVLTGVDIVIEPGKLLESGEIEWSGEQIPVPNDGGFVRDLLPRNGPVSDTDPFRFTTTYTYSETSGHEPEEKLTRVEFVMELLREWERVVAIIEAVGAHHAKEKQRIIDAMEVLKGTYSFQELGTSLDYMRESLTLHPLETIQG